MKNTFNNATDVFEYYFDYIMKNGVDFSGNKTIFNEGFVIENPLANRISTKWRKWSNRYAVQEWDWYLSGDPSALVIGKKAKIWLQIMDENGNVNSNYGYQWKRGDQLNYVIRELKDNPESRRASISIYDGKEHHIYAKDTPCTQYINFYIYEDKLHMNVHMRSNDLVYGFCNDQYCFSKLQEMVAKELDLKIGKYFHFANNLHIYPMHFNMKKKNEK